MNDHKVSGAKSAAGFFQNSSRDTEPPGKTMALGVFYIAIAFLGSLISAFTFSFLLIPFLFVLAYGCSLIIAAIRASRIIDTGDGAEFLLYLRKTARKAHRSTTVLTLWLAFKYISHKHRKTIQENKIEGEPVFPKENAGAIIYSVNYDPILKSKPKLVLTTRFGFLHILEITVALPILMVRVWSYASYVFEFTYEKGRLGGTSLLGPARAQRRLNIVEHLSRKQAIREAHSISARAMRMQNAIDL